MVRRGLALVGARPRCPGARPTAGCRHAARWQAPGWRRPADEPPPASAKLTFSPAADAKNVSPADPVTVEVANGTLDDGGA